MLLWQPLECRVILLCIVFSRLMMVSANPAKTDDDNVDMHTVNSYTNYNGYATWFTAGGANRMAHYDVTDDVITRKL